MRSAQARRTLSRKSWFILLRAASAYTAVAAVAWGPLGESLDAGLLTCSQGLRNAAAAFGCLCLVFAADGAKLFAEAWQGRSTMMKPRLNEALRATLVLFWLAAAHNAMVVAQAARAGCPPPQGFSAQHPRPSIHDPASPNVLMVIIDDLRYDGHALADAPHLRSLLVGPGVVSFPHAYAAFPVCAPSRTAIFLGLRPSTTHLVRPPSKPNSWARSDLPPHLQLWPSLPARFRDAHRATYSVGKTFGA